MFAYFSVIKWHRLNFSSPGDWIVDCLFSSLKKWHIVLISCDQNIELWFVCLFVIKWHRLNFLSPGDWIVVRRRLDRVDSRQPIFQLRTLKGCQGMMFWRRDSWRVNRGRRLKTLRDSWSINGRLFFGFDEKIQNLKSTFDYEDNIKIIVW